MIFMESTIDGRCDVRCVSDVRNRRFLTSESFICYGRVRLNCWNIVWISTKGAACILEP